MYRQINPVGSPLEFLRSSPVDSQRHNRVVRPAGSRPTDRPVCLPDLHRSARLHNLLFSLLGSLRWPRLHSPRNVPLSSPVTSPLDNLPCNRRRSQFASHLVNLLRSHLVALQEFLPRNPVRGHPNVPHLVPQNAPAHNLPPAHHLFQRGSPLVCLPFNLPCRPQLNHLPALVSHPVNNLPASLPASPLFNPRIVQQSSHQIVRQCLPQTNPLRDPRSSLLSNPVGVLRYSHLISRPRLPAVAPRCNQANSQPRNLQDSLHISPSTDPPASRLQDLLSVHRRSLLSSPASNLRFSPPTAPQNSQVVDLQISLLRSLLWCPPLFPHISPVVCPLNSQPVDPPLNPQDSPQVTHPSSRLSNQVNSRVCNLQANQPNNLWPLRQANPPSAPQGSLHGNPLQVRQTSLPNAQRHSRADSLHDAQLLNLRSSR